MANLLEQLKNTKKEKQKINFAFLLNFTLNNNMWYNIAGEREVCKMKKIKNVAIIAHVDHGKTTLVDQLLKQSGTFRDNEAIDERVMDSNDIEKERGITIFS